MYSDLFHFKQGTKFKQGTEFEFVREGVGRFFRYYDISGKDIGTNMWATSRYGYRINA